MSDIIDRLREPLAGLGETYATFCARMAQDRRDAADEITKLREALHAIACNTEPDAIRHRDYDHLAQNIHACARAAIGEEK
jgi:hypothetical protein